MKKILLCLLALLLLCGCAKDSTPAQIPEQAQLGSIHSVTPSYETRYFARTMDIWKTAETTASFQAAYEQVLPALTETNKTIPEGDQYFFYVFHKRNDENQRLYLRLVDDGKGCWLELKPKTLNPDWILTYTLTREAAQPLLELFAGEPTGKPHIEGHPDGRVVPFLERIEKGWPIFEGTVTAVSKEVKEFSLHEGLQYGWLYREFTVEVAKCYSGDLKEGDKLTYRVFGGETEDYSFSVPGAPQVSVGDYVVVAAPEHSFATAYHVFPATVLNEYYATFTPPIGLFPIGDGLVPKTYYTSQLGSLVSGRYTYDLDEYAASRENLPERVTERELAELRMEYPRHGGFHPLSQRIAITKWDSLRSDSLSGLVILDFIGDYCIQSPAPKRTLFEGPALNYRTAEGVIYLFARVEEVLIGCEDLQVGDLVPVSLGTTYTSSGIESFRMALEGKRFVSLVSQQKEEDSYYLPNGLSSSEMGRFFLTPDDVVLYCGYDFDTVLDECSGMYLSAFTELIREKLFSGE